MTTSAKQPGSTLPAAAGGRPNGFSVILGNPPWERVKLQDQEFFAQRDPAVAGAPNASARKKAISALKSTNPGLLKEFEEATRQAEGESHLLRSSGRYPLCGRGDINTYAVFAESMRHAISQTGRMGVIVPTGIATDDTTKFFFGDLIETRSVVSLFSFAEIRAIFPGTDDRNPCCLLCTGASRSEGIRDIQFAFGLWSVEDMAEAGKRFVMSPEDIVLLNPNTRTCPVFRSERDAEITKAIYRRVPVLIREATGTTAESNPWGLNFLRMFDMANASGLFIAPEVACPAVSEALAAAPTATPPYLPLYEAKMLHQFDHRWATYARPRADWLSTPILTKVNKDGKREPETRDVTPEEQANPAMLAAPRYWVVSDAVWSRIPKHPKDLALAVDTGDAEFARKVLAMWCAGRLLELGDPTAAKALLDWAVPLQLPDVVATSFARMRADAYAIRLHRKYPLTAVDADRIGASFDAPLAIAAELVERFTPNWLLGFRDIARNTDERTLIVTALPRVAAGHKAPLMFPEGRDAKQAACLIACMNAFVVDYAARQKVGGTSMSYFFLKQFPVLLPSAFAAPCPWDESQTLADWIAPRVLELVYTAHDLAGFARDLGYDGLPFRWGPARRAQIRAELDAAFFHLYGINRDDAAYIMDTFLVFKARDEERNGGVYRTKETILAIYDEMGPVRPGTPATEPATQRKAP